MKKLTLSMTRFRRVSASAAVLALASFTAAGCDPATGPDAIGGPGAVTGVEVVVIPIGTRTTNVVRTTTLQLLAAPHDANNLFVNTPVTWASSDAAKATVDANGLVTIGSGAAAGGDVNITATAGGKTGTYPLNVQHPVTAVAVTPPTSTIRQEGTVALSAGLTEAAGAAAVGRTVTWTSSNTAVATVGASTGVVAGVADGTATITATADNGEVADVAGTASVTVSGLPLVATVAVTPASPFRGIGQTVQMTHASSAASGTAIAGTTAAWSSSAPGVATVDPVTGLVTIVGVGTTSIRATVDNGAGTSTNVVGSTTLRGATQLIKGVTQAVPTTTAGESYFYAFVVPVGVTTFTVTTTGGTGDGDIFIRNPALTTTVCQSFNSGNDEICTVNNAVQGTYRIEMNAWDGAPPNTAGMMISVTHP